MYRSVFARDMCAEMDMWQALKVYAFAPGLDPEALEVQLERGLLTLAGARHSPHCQINGTSMDSSQEGASHEGSSREGATHHSSGTKAAVHINERFEGAFRSVVTLSEDADPDEVQASYRDGLPCITAQCRASAQPRHISIEVK